MAVLAAAAALAAATGGFRVALVEQPSPLVAYPTSSQFQQSQNPSFVPRSPHLPHGGLMVRLQNCSAPDYPGKGPTNQSGCNYGSGGGSDCYGDSGFVRDHIGFVPFPAGYTGADPPTGLPRITPEHIVFSPQPGLADEKWGTQDPQCAWDPHTSQYFLSYTAWAGPSAGWGQKAALSQTPGDPASWKRIGPTFTPNNSWPITPKGSESNIKCSALFTMPGENASPRYYLFSGDVTPHGARVSSSDSLHGPWSRRELVSGGDVGKPGAWDDHMGCFTPPVELAGPLQGHLLSFCEWQPPSSFPSRCAEDGARLQTMRTSSHSLVSQAFRSDGPS